MKLFFRRGGNLTQLNDQMNSADLVTHCALDLNFPLAIRRGAILLHPTSLPGPAAHGQIGTEAERFVDFLAAGGIGVWQVLPLGPTQANRSPYQTDSSMAIDPKLICADLLSRWGWLTGAEADLAKNRQDASEWVVGQSLSNFLADSTSVDQQRYRRFIAAAHSWLDDYCLFRVIKAMHGEQPWWHWRPDLRTRNTGAIGKIREQFTRELELQRFGQFLADCQWRSIKSYANAHGVDLFGDLPIYVAEDSAETWADQSQFQLGENGRPSHIAGVPPDYFSATGQRWGNPLYDWKRMQAEDFRWWIHRLKVQLERFDLLRIDHFRGFESYWASPYNEDTAVNGRWRRAPGIALFESLSRRFGRLPLVAEDLGLITPAVHRLRDRFGLPGMRVLQFAFDGSPENPHLPNNYVPNCVAYTGTHDNDTLVGWLASREAPDRKTLQEYFAVDETNLDTAIIDVIMASTANLAVLPLQDVLRLGSEHRMNTPGTLTGNWQWRFSWQQVPADASAQLQATMARSNRHMSHQSTAQEDAQGDIQRDIQ